MRWVVFAIGGAALVVLFWGLWSIDPPAIGLVENYSDLQLAAVERFEAVLDANFTVATAITGALGALALGLGGEKLVLNQRQTPPVFLAVLFSVGSAMAGAVARLHLVEMLANSAEPYLTRPVIQTPLLFQQFLLLAALAAIGWLVVDGVGRSEGGAA